MTGSFERMDSTARTYREHGDLASRLFDGIAPKGHGGTARLAGTPECRKWAPVRTFSAAEFGPGSLSPRVLKSGHLPQRHPGGGNIPPAKTSRPKSLGGFHEVPSTP